MIRFQADADLKPSIRVGVLRRNPGIDFQPFSGTLPEGLSDDLVQSFAAAQDRVLVSHDLRTMSWHFPAFILTNSSPGVILIPQRLPIARAIDDLLLLWEASRPDEWRNRLIYLPSLTVGCSWVGSRSD
jgi:Domain of unknown function (DUF5615)